MFALLRVRCVIVGHRDDGLLPSMMMAESWSAWRKAMRKLSSLARVNKDSASLRMCGRPFASRCWWMDAGYDP